LNSCQKRYVCRQKGLEKNEGENQIDLDCFDGKLLGKVTILIISQWVKVICRLKTAHWRAEGPT